MFGIPSNVLPLFLMGLVVLIFGIKGLKHFFDVKTPLTLYYALSGILFGLSGICYSLPFAITTNNDILRLFVTIADALFYVGIFVQLRIIWYLGLNKSIGFIWIILPVVALSILSLILDLKDRSQAIYYVENGLAIFSTAQTSLYLLAFLSLSIIAVGVLTLLQVKNLPDSKQKIRLITLGGMFLLAGVTVEYNFLFLQGSNTSPAIIIGYAIAIAGFLLGLFFVSRKKK